MYCGYPVFAEYYRIWQSFGHIYEKVSILPPIYQKWGHYKEVFLYAPRRCENLCISSEISVNFGQVEKEKFYTPRIVAASVGDAL